MCGATLHLNNYKDVKVEQSIFNDKLFILTIATEHVHVDLVGTQEQFTRVFNDAYIELANLKQKGVA